LGSLGSPDQKGKKEVRVGRPGGDHGGYEKVLGFGQGGGLKTNHQSLVGVLGDQKLPNRGKSGKKGPPLWGWGEDNNLVVLGEGARSLVTARG